MIPDKDRLRTFNALLNSGQAEADLSALAAVPANSPQLAKFRDNPARSHKEILWLLCGLLTKEQIIAAREAYAAANAPAQDAGNDNPDSGSDETQNQGGDNDNPDPGNDETQNQGGDNDNPDPGSDETQNQGGDNDNPDPGNDEPQNPE